MGKSDKRKKKEKRRAERAKFLHDGNLHPGAGNPPDGSDNESESGTDGEETGEDVTMSDEKERGPWVDETIQNFVKNYSDDNVAIKLFGPTCSDQELANAKDFFDKINDIIEGENRSHGYTGSNVYVGIIDDVEYFSTRAAWLESLNQFHAKKKDAASVWDDFDKLSSNIDKFNKLNSLPAGWNLTATWAEEILGKRNPVNQDHANESDVDNLAYDLQSLKVRAKPAYTKENRCRVLYWWKTGGSSTDCFVEYERGGRHVHRIESGDYHDYDPEAVPRVSTEDRLLFRKNEGKWEYSEKDIDKIVAVGWKISGDCDPDDDPLQHIHPPDAGALAAEILYPRTEILILFKHGVTSLETRGGLRRVMRRKVVADRMIYKMAEERELKYTSARARSKENGSEKSVHFADDALSAYSIGRLRRSTSPTSSRTSKKEQRKGAAADHSLVDENRWLKEKLALLEERLQASDSGSDSGSDTDSHYSSRRSVRSRGSQRSRESRRPRRYYD
ncbi:hypothetical protein AJ80_09687 [Polytolypa hystricis UAMH7299]|uniref:Uncharacterized protein n=1 Tax=Polytolypa hystricis (strain UAMH7299) TaxID=1447883 RepID=A0A2B7WLV3_POLH7|nr:hypothetical protein AJ80_09687 [Polytolypa hystricis UAMH7299]